MLLEFYHFRNGEAYFKFSIYEFILSEIKVKTDEIYPIMLLDRFERKNIEDTSTYILAIAINKEIGCLNTDYIFNLSITSFYELKYTTKIQTEKTTIRGKATEMSSHFVRRFDIKRSKDKYEF
jgi:hypothetical protein